MGIIAWRSGPFCGAARQPHPPPPVAARRLPGWPGPGYEADLLVGALLMAAPLPRGILIGALAGHLDCLKSPFGLLARNSCVWLCL